LIEKSLLEYWLADSVLTGLLGGNKVYFQRAPSGVKMPWMTFNVPPRGVRGNMTQGFIEEQVVVSVEVEHQNFVEGREIAEQARSRVEGFRGDLSDSDDVYITCSPIGCLDGFTGSYRYLFTAAVRFKEARS